MIEASIDAVPGLLPRFCLLALILAVPTALIAMARRRPVVAPTLLAASVAGAVSVTLLPGSSEDAMRGLCDTGQPFPSLFSSPSALLNVALFTPVAILGVLVLRRPVTVIAVLTLFSGFVELIQATTPLGRSCSVTDIAANTTGTLIGCCAAAAWLRLRNDRITWFSKDVVWAAGLAILGIAGVTGLLRSVTTPVDTVTALDRAEAHTRSMDEAYEWISRVAEDVFGKGTAVGETEEDKGETRTRITVRTNRGELIVWWPDKTVEHAWTYDPAGRRAP
ncbi:VanZ family protein [Streptomyces sp. URMC 123]|uniref:VanZ family protein n=1 Tax=Streptomyces sp. URMC 123 TaxID=3423403 RepID=UPI003F1E33A7